jgi:sulfatase modifying factor 1
MRFLMIPVFLACIIFSKNDPTVANPQPQGPVKGKSWDLSLNRNTRLPMSWIPAGKFTMGSPASEAGRKPDESPQMMVTLTKGYWLGCTEVTIEQWKAVMGSNVRQQAMKLLSDSTLYDFNGKKSTIRAFMGFGPNDVDKILSHENDETPMYFVSWYQAMDFCKRLTEKERAARCLPAGYEYTLPTEAQWEYACRAGTIGPTYAASTDSIAWYGANSFQGYTGKGQGTPNAGPHNAGGKPANKWGMQDMPGNIWEWCSDWYGPYPGGQVINPVGPASGGYKANRGGSFGSGIYDERSAARAQNPPNEQSAWRGFRLALAAVKR